MPTFSWGRFPDPECLSSTILYCAQSFSSASPSFPRVYMSLILSGRKNQELHGRTVCVQTYRKEIILRQRLKVISLRLLSGLHPNYGVTALPSEPARPVTPASSAGLRHFSRVAASPCTPPCAVRSWALNGQGRPGLPRPPGALRGVRAAVRTGRDAGKLAAAQSLVPQGKRLVARPQKCPLLTVFDGMAVLARKALLCGTVFWAPLPAGPSPGLPRRHRPAQRDGLLRARGAGPRSCSEPLGKRSFFFLILSNMETRSRHGEVRGWPHSRHFSFPVIRSHFANPHCAPWPAPSPGTRGSLPPLR